MNRADTSVFIGGDQILCIKLWSADVAGGMFAPPRPEPKACCFPCRRQKWEKSSQERLSLIQSGGMLLEFTGATVIDPIRGYVARVHRSDCH